MSKVAIYPGTFDPITFGHIDVIKKSLKLFDKIVVAVSDGENKTTHYAICTGIMALGMMVPGMFSGFLQENFGYFNFFCWVMLSTIPGLILLKFLPIDSNFGLKRD